MSEETTYDELFDKAQKLARANNMFIVKKMRTLLLYRRGNPLPGMACRNVLIAKRSSIRTMQKCINKILSH